MTKYLTAVLLLLATPVLAETMTSYIPFGGGPRVVEITSDNRARGCMTRTYILDGVIIQEGEANCETRRVDQISPEQNHYGVNQGPNKIIELN